jgi:hypothetical protein
VSGPAQGLDGRRKAADAFTKGCVGVQPQGKERLDNLEDEDRDHSKIEPDFAWKTSKNNPENARPTFQRSEYAKKFTRSLLTPRALSGKWHTRQSGAPARRVAHPSIRGTRAVGVRKEIHQEPLDTVGPFREVAHP